MSTIGAVSDIRPPWDGRLMVSAERGDGSDSSIFARTATPAGNTTFPSRTIEFDGVNDWVQYADSDTLSFTDGSGTDLPFTVMAWVKLDNTTGQRCIASKEDFNGVNGSEWVFNISGGRLQGIIAAATGNTGKIRNGNTTTLAAGTWYHVAFTYSGSETISGIKLWVNGVEEASYTTFVDTAMPGMSNTSAKYYLGISSGTQGINYYDLDGSLADLRHFAGEKTAQEINAIYINGLGVTRP